MNKSFFFRVVLLAAAALAAAGSVESQQIAFTWDDLPAHGALPPGETRVEIGRKLIAAMKEAKMPPVYGFVNAAQLQNEPDSAPMLKEWREAGFFLGNHTWSHMNLNTNTVADWEADFLRDEATLQQYAAGSDWRWLRYPYVAEGDTPEKKNEVRKFLAARGYRIAAVTMSFSDYLWNEPYARCVAKSDDAAIARLESSYLDAASADADYRRALSQAALGRQIPFVLLMHVGAFDARMLPRLLELYRRKGFTFVSLEEAEIDPWYKAAVDLSQPAQADSLESKALGKTLPPPPRLALDLNSLCR